MLITTVSDGIYSDTQSVGIIVEDTPEKPEISSPSVFNVSEPQTSIGSIVATDPDGDSLTYSLSGNDAQFITINSNSGFMEFNNSTDYETKNVYQVSAIVTDGTAFGTVAQSIIINILDGNDAPVITSSSQFNADEQQRSIGTVIANDENGDAMIFSLQSGDELSINQTTGELSFIEIPDYEVKLHILMLFLLQMEACKHLNL